jgi:signal transduction histidine kinase
MRQGARLANILLVEDTPGKAAALEAILQPLEQCVVLAHSGREALRCLLKEEFALILLDVRMSEMDGFETASLIRQRRRSEHIPIIFITAFDQAELDMARGYSLGAVDFIFSPIVPEVLRAKALVFVELFQREQDVKDLYAAAQAANIAKSEFLNLAAHELRTPLSVVLGYLSMLRDGSFGSSPERWKSPLEILNTKTQELNRIVDDLLMASRMESGSLALKLETVDLRHEVEEAVERARPRAKLLGGSLETRLPNTPVLVEADRSQLARIADNLINNAMTYNVGPARVIVRVVAEGVGKDPRIEVEDNGIGITPGMEERIFERFVRLDDPILGPVPGTGLGLYLGRELAHRHGGTLVLENTETAKGSLFCLCLPAASNDAKRAGSSNPSLRLQTTAS